MTQREQAAQPAPEGFEYFYRTSYRDLVRTAMFAGATLEEAEDAASKTLADMLRIWPVRGFPLAYARTAVFHNFLKAKAGGSQRIVQRLVERGHVPLTEGAEDAELFTIEGAQWVSDVLSKLPPAQQEVMKYIANGLDRQEIAGILGISNDAVRSRVYAARGRLITILSPDGEFKQSRPSTGRSSGEEA